MRCRIHKHIWLYENMTEKLGYCEECNKWYELKKCKKCGKELEDIDFTLSTSDGLLTGSGCNHCLFKLLERAVKDG